MDIGYNGTIQRILQKIIEQPLHGFYLGSFRDANEVEQERGRAFGYFVEGIAPFSTTVPVVKHSLLLEAFLSAPHGQVLGFKHSPEGLQVQFKDDVRSQTDLDVLRELQAGAIAYCDELITAYGPPILDLECDMATLQVPLKLLAERDIQVPVAVNRALSVEDEFTGSGTIAAGAHLLTQL